MKPAKDYLFVFRFKESFLSFFLLLYNTEFTYSGTYTNTRHSLAFSAKLRYKCNNQYLLTYYSVQLVQAKCKNLLAIYFSDKAR